MPRIQSPEIVSGARGPRGGVESVMLAGDPADFRPQVKGSAPENAAHFVSRFREYAIVITTEPDHVTSSGQIVRGRNKGVRFKDFNFITTDPETIAKIRSLKGYGLSRDVWEKSQQDEHLAKKSLAAAEAAIDALPEERQAEFAAKLAAKFKTFQLPTLAVQAQASPPEDIEEEDTPLEDEDSN